ncbi:RidA family protein [Enemella sp. A6]|uniref:RidA family protein n=1 Tax=Enemella sp. A6 TaxID=3440152 RepID=UPI003EB84236
MSAPSERLRGLGLTLPPVAAPVADYVPAVRTGNLVYTSGQLPFVGGELPTTGKVGDAVTLDEAVQQARDATLNALAAAAEQAGGLDAITRVLKLTVYVASSPFFTEQPKVANGASLLLGEIFGADGEHARSAVGVAALPLDAAVELELLVEVN